MRLQRAEALRLPKLDRLHGSARVARVCPHVRDVLRARDTRLRELTCPLWGRGWRMRWRPACWQRHVDAHPARSMTMITLLPAPSRGVRGVHRSVRMGGCGAHCCAQLGASQAAACPETPVRAWRSEGAGAASPVPRGPNDSRHAAARSQRGHGGGGACSTALSTAPPRAERARGEKNGRGARVHTGSA